MDIAPSNKTEIITYEIVRLFPKLWNISKAFRKRLIWILKSKRITLRSTEHSSNTALALDCKKQFDIALKELKTKLKEDNQFLKTNKYLAYQKDVDRFLKRAPELECSLNLQQPIKPVYLPNVNNLLLNSAPKIGNIRFPSEIDNYLNLEFGHIEWLKIGENDETSPIQQILNKISSINHLEIYHAKIETELDFSKIKINKVNITQTILRAKVKLPDNLQYLGFNCFEFYDFLEFKQIEKCCLEGRISLSKEIEFLKRLKKLNKTKKMTGISNFKEIKAFLPSSLRKIKIEDPKLQGTVKKSEFPYLISLEANLPISVIEELNLRTVPRIIKEKFEGKLKVRPREVIVTTNNCGFINNHPELFEKLNKIKLVNRSLSFKFLTNQIGALCSVIAKKEYLKCKSITRLNFEK